MEENTGYLWREEDARTLHFDGLSFKTVSVDSLLIQHAFSAFHRHPKLDVSESYAWRTIQQEFIDATERRISDSNDSIATGSMKVEQDLPDRFSELVLPRQLDLKFSADERMLSIHFSIAGQGNIPPATSMTEVSYSRIRRSLSEYQNSLIDPYGLYQSFKTSDQRWFFHLKTADQMFDKDEFSLHNIAGMSMGYNMLKDFIACIGVLFPTGPTDDWQDNLLSLPDWVANKAKEGYIIFEPR